MLPPDETPGPYVGMLVAECHPWIANLCMKHEGVDHDLLLRLHDDYSLDDLYAIDELEQVRRSWARAEKANARAKAGDE